VNCTALQKMMQVGIGEERAVQWVYAHEAFEMCAKDMPDAVAVQQENESITYGQLEQRASSLAAILIKRGVGRGHFVGVLTCRSIEMIVSIFGVLKAGAAYIVMDKFLPEARIANILNVSQCSLILVSSGGPPVTNNIDAPVIYLKDVAYDIPLVGNEIIFKPTDPAYVVFTSGSTGLPKGVVVSHGALCNFFGCGYNMLQVRKGDRVGQVCSIGFDLCVGEIFCTLSAGGTLVLASMEGNYLQVMQNTDTILCTPSALAKCDPVDVPNLKLVIVVGEPVPPILVSKWKDAVAFYNGYGPSEATIVTCCGLLTDSNCVTAGTPIPNTFHYILNDQMELVTAENEQGQLYLGGSCVALGYMNRRELTDSKFVPNPFLNDGSKMYQTGDICSWKYNAHSPDKLELVYHGRTDDMVKLNGYRIELEEITSTVLTQESVVAAATVVKENVIYTFVTPKSANIQAIRLVISKLLPTYMMPAVIISMETFPMTANGKARLDIDLD
jgi:D-alanine--poly(phosphoribitol) ligase subunit 1